MFLIFFFFIKISLMRFQMNEENITKYFFFMKLFFLSFKTHEVEIFVISEERICFGKMVKKFSKWFYCVYICYYALYCKRSENLFLTIQREYFYINNYLLLFCNLSFTVINGQIRKLHSLTIRIL